MSGYGGTDDESLHAIIMSENGIGAARSMITGSVLTECVDCGEEISPARVEALRKLNMKCHYCIQCQEHHNAPPRIKMLDNIL